MPRHVAFLRAVNVGKRRMEMAELRRVLEAAGLDDVSTYIASGNAIFSSAKRSTTLEPLVEAAIEEAFGFLAEAFIRPADQVVEIAGRTPFGSIDSGTTHLAVFLRTAPSAAEAKAIEAMSGEKDELKVIGAEVHWHIEGKSLDTLLKPKDWKAAGAALNTGRNMTMLRKLADRISG
ncbi:DUF1697 domain-containing protein [Aquihabitans sp. McL0605]|uniref:DUF1697 domain-containing protein n=1 Tax=Aquihabitans sp. McL0605 TaxID=3415671 RepID=UPI003CF5ACB6